MHKRWRLRTITREVTLEPGDGICLMRATLAPESPKALARAHAFIRADERRICVASREEALTINGRAAPGRVAVLDGQVTYAVRIGNASIEVSPVRSQFKHWSEDAGRCALSGEPLRSGDPVIACPCSTVVLARFAREFGDACPRCGLRWNEAVEEAQ